MRAATQRECPMPNKALIRALWWEAQHLKFDGPAHALCAVHGFDRHQAYFLAVNSGCRFPVEEILSDGAPAEPLTWTVSLPDGSSE